MTCLEAVMGKDGICQTESVCQEESAKSQWKKPAHRSLGLCSADRGVRPVGSMGANHEYGLHITVLTSSAFQVRLEHT